MYISTKALKSKRRFQTVASPLQFILESYWPLMAYNDLDLDDFSDSGFPSELSPGNTSQIDID